MRQGDLFGGPVSATRPRSLFDDPDRVPALGLDPRFAGLVRLAALGYPGKLIESRTWVISHRGPLLVCATAGAATAEDEELGAAFAAARAELVPDRIPAEVFDVEVARAGVAVALVTVAGVRPLAAADWPRSWYPAPGSACIARGRALVGWELTNLWPVAPFQVRCAPGLFGVPAEQVRAALLEGATSASDMIREDWPGLGVRWGA